ncbi:hypothetical protein G6F32_016969 [Rhizopus arrhizus]|nr:hypothetical protein G6F32_016969 [Rhizopus arrhizus]
MPWGRHGQFGSCGASGAVLGMLGPQTADIGWGSGDGAVCVLSSPADDPVLGAGHECPSGNASWPRVLAVERADHLPIDRGRLRGTPPDGRGRGTAG